MEDFLAATWGYWVYWALGLFTGANLGYALARWRLQRGLRRIAQEYADEYFAQEHARVAQELAALDGLEEAVRRAVVAGQNSDYTHVAH